MVDPKPGTRASRNNWWTKRRPSRLKTSMVGLSTAAILSVYAVGYANSDTHDGADASVAIATGTPAAAPGTVTPDTTRSSGSATTTPRATATATATKTATAAGYADGTYTGSGTSRHGGMTVTVVVQDGKLVSAEITSCNTRYPCSRISSLPAKVVAAQVATTDYVSGATDSSRAYMQAVAAALAKAKS